MVSPSRKLLGWSESAASRHLRARGIQQPFPLRCRSAGTLRTNPRPARQRFAALVPAASPFNFCAAAGDGAEGTDDESK
jgi:hypothetical protein